MEPLSKADQQLLDAAYDAGRRHCCPPNHTVATAARTADGSILTAVNVAHYSGGPCAEIVIIGIAASQDIHHLDAIATVGTNSHPGLRPPCGWCRQILYDYFPDLTVITGTDQEPRALPIAALLPGMSEWLDHHTAGTPSRTSNRPLRSPS
ncbi:cytidine deaminase [Kitasatospora cystarginea]|uniref:Cytidine deaminase n=1 Tax=Kitasatospora cystarginea TaxID=58350 RepID=A0ABN3ERC1_9ACTN